MARRLTRKQMKKDEFVTLVDRAIHWVNSNWQQAALGLGGAIAIALLWWGVTAFFASREASAGRAMTQALETYAPPADATDKTAKDKPTFATEGARLDAAEAAFKKIESRYWLTPQAKLAKIYEARIAVQRGDTDRAIRLLSGIASSRSDGPIVRIAAYDLIRLQIEKAGDGEVAGELEAMITGKDPRLPRDVAMFLLAELRAKQGKPDEAAKLYRQLTKDFPESPYRYEAQQRMTAAS